MDIELLLMEAEEKMLISVEHYVQNLSKITSGRANPKILQNIKIDYFETQTPIDQIASISIPEARQILIKPYDMSTVKNIVGAINKAHLNFTAVDEGDKIRITLPEMTTEKRREMIKSLSTYTEQAKITIRSSRQEANKAVKNDEETSEDDERNYLNKIQKLTDKYIQKIDDETKEKEKDLMTI